MPTRYVRSDTAPLYAEATGRKKVIDLLWGDRVTYARAGDGARIRVRARGREGHVARGALGEEALLEVYFIDVGQGDGVLICTPDRRHVLIDGGYKRRAQPTGKNAADFVDWKFAKDYRRDRIRLDALVASHCDADHYGGLRDLIDPNETEELDLDTVEVGAFYHAGVGWWREPGRRRWLGPTEGGYLTRLMEDRASAVAALENDGGPTLQGEWAEFIRCVTDLGCPVERLSQRTGHLPAFGPDDGPATLRVLGPVEEERGGSPALRSLGSSSQNTNGHSVLLRLDYGRTRILLTGDLNAGAQQALLGHYTGMRQELACDVAKACHHGSDDSSYEFLSTLAASATVISSGDAEGHGHPRPSIVAASALTGHARIEDDRVATPLVYSTEVARSLRLGRVLEVRAGGYPAGDGTVDVRLTSDAGARVHYAETSAGALRPRRRSRALGGAYVVSGVVYGLVNVRTDGNRILCATLNERDHSWDIKTFESRF